MHISVSVFSLADLFAVISHSIIMALYNYILFLAAIRSENSYYIATVENLFEKNRFDRHVP